MNAEEKARLRALAEQTAHEITAVPNSGGGYTNVCHRCGEVGVGLAPTLPCLGSKVERAIPALLDALEAAGQQLATALEHGQEVWDARERAEADLADEKRRHAGLRAGVSLAAQGLAAWSGMPGDEGRVRGVEHSLRALLDTATKEPT